MSDSETIFAEELRNLMPAKLAKECEPELDPGCKLTFCQGVLEGTTAIFLKAYADGQYLVRLESPPDGTFAKIPPHLVSVTPQSDESLND